MGKGISGYQGHRQPTNGIADSRLTTKLSGPGRHRTRRRYQQLPWPGSAEAPGWAARPRHISPATPDQAHTASDGTPPATADQSPNHQRHPDDLTDHRRSLDLKQDAEIGPGRLTTKLSGPGPLRTRRRCQRAPWPGSAEAPGWAARPRDIPPAIPDQAHTASDGTPPATADQSPNHQRHPDDLTDHRRQLDPKQDADIGPGRLTTKLSGPGPLRTRRRCQRAPWPGSAEAPCWAARPRDIPPAIPDQAHTASDGTPPATADQSPNHQRHPDDLTDHRRWFNPKQDADIGPGRLTTKLSGPGPLRTRRRCQRAPWPGSAEAPGWAARPRDIPPAIPDQAHTASDGTPPATADQSPNHQRHPDDLTDHRRQLDPKQDADIGPGRLTWK